MSMFDRFRRDKQDGEFKAFAETQDDMQPENQTMEEKVSNPEIEGGVPDIQSVSGSSKSPQQMVMLGVAFLGFGIALASLAYWLNRETPVEETQLERPEVSGDSRYNFAEDQARIKLENDLPQASSEPEGELPEGIVPATSSAPAGMPTDNSYSDSSSAPAEPPPKDRRLQGEVLIGETGSSMSSGSPNSDNNTTTISGLSPDEMAGLNPDNDTGGTSSNSGSAFAGRLNPTQTAAAKALRRFNSNYLLAKGTNIGCTMQTKIVTTQPGFTRCIVDKDVYSANGKVLLLERGTKITGEQTSALLQGQARVFVLWNEAETPHGVKINLASPAAGQLGEAGVGARVKYHFWRRFGGAIMISLIGDLGDYASNRRSNRNGDGQTFNFDNTSESAQDMATEALKNSINIPPTGYVNQGSIINIMVARDVDFSDVYERVNPYELPVPELESTTQIKQ